jgi:predicted transcriptional regulator
LTGETQLRARRTRIKILRAIADRNGVAGFSDIKVSTGLSTGSIYYHLERMGSYVTKDSKHYMITEEGLQLLREVDQKYASVAAPQRKEEERAPAPPSESFGEETVRQVRRWNVRQYMFIGILASVVAFATVGIFTSWQTLYVFAGMSAGLISLVAVAATLSASLFMLKKSHPLIGYKGTMLSVSVLAALLVSVLLVSGLEYTSAAYSQPYDNSMDALLSSYSMHWQIR